jgi:hypothetical protein
MYVFQVRVVFAGQGETLAFLEFDGSGSSNRNWFSQSRLLQSSWSDLDKKTSLNYFSIKG